MKTGASDNFSTELQAATAQALAADKHATAAKKQAHLAKVQLKAAKKEFKAAKNAFKQAKKTARKAAKDAKVAQKAVQKYLDDRRKKGKKTVQKIPVGRADSRPAKAKQSGKAPAPTEAGNHSP